MTAALDFGVHAPFVWSCFALTAAVVVGLALDTAIKGWRAKARLKAAEAQEAARRGG